MKKFKKIVSVVLFVMMINVFSPLMVLVNAYEANVNTLVSNLDTGISNIKNKIDLSKNNSLYNTDKAYSSAVVTVSSDVDYLENQVTLVKNDLSSVKLSDIASNTSNSNISTGYNDYINACGSDYIIDMDDIKDVECSVSLNGVSSKIVYISSSDLINEIDSIYISSLNSKIISYNNSYDSKFNNYKNVYNHYINTTLATSVNTLNGYYNEVNDYINNENTLGNRPDVMVNGKNIVDLINNDIKKVSSKNDVYNVNELDGMISEVDLIVSDAKNSKNLFFANNKSYIELGIDSEITALIDKYNSNYNDFNTWFTSAGLDINAIDYVSLSSKIDNSFKVLVKNNVLLEEDYNNLIKKINDYLKRKPSDKSVIDGLLAGLNIAHDRFNKDRIISLLERVVNDTSFTSEDTVDNLYFIRDYDVSEVVKKKLFNSKKSFYSLSINDYKNNILDDSIILYDVKNVPNDLARKIVYNASFTYSDDEYKLYTYDRAGQLLSTYDIEISGDVNNDRLINQQDVDMMHQLLVSSSLSDELFKRCDFNNDGKFDVKDLVGLNNLVSGIFTNDIKASIKVVKEVSNNTISYKIYLKSNGLVNGFSFDVDTSSDLVFNKMITNNNVLLKNDDHKLFIVGYGNFNDGDLLLSLIYDRDEVKDYTTFKINNGILATGSDKSTDNVSFSDVIKNVTDEESNNTSEEVVPLSDNADDAEGQVIIYKDDTSVSDSDKDPVKVTSKDIDDQNKINIKSLIKIVVVVLLGALIIYFLSKEDEETEALKEDKEKKTE